MVATGEVGVVTWADILVEVAAPQVLIANATGVRVRRVQGHTPRAHQDQRDHSGMTVHSVTTCADCPFYYPCRDYDVCSHEDAGGDGLVDCERLPVWCPLRKDFTLARRHVETEPYYRKGLEVHEARDRGVSSLYIRASSADKAKRICDALNATET